MEDQAAADIERLFDPEISGILAELEDGPKSASHLCQKAQISASELQQRLEYLVGRGFVSCEGSGDPVYSADAAKMAKAVESGADFDSAIDGITKMDSYLN